MKELRALCNSAVDGIRPIINEEDMTNLQADIDGPVSTPFEGGVFRVKLVIGPDFPNTPPKAIFLTKIFHPNVSGSGEICVDTLKRDWKASHTVQHVLLVIRCLLIDPNPASALNEEASKLLLEAYDDYFKRAALLTRIHARAKHQSAPAPSSSSSSSSSSSGGDKLDKTDEKMAAAVAGAAAAAAATGGNATVTATRATIAAPKKAAASADKSKIVKKKSLKRL